MESRNSLQPFIRRALVVAAIIVLLSLAWRLRELLILAFGAVVVAVILRLIARPFHKRLGLSAGASFGLAVLTGGAIISVPIWLLGAQLADQTRSLTQLIPAALQLVQTHLERFGLGGLLGEWIGSSASGQEALLDRFASSISNGILQALLVVTGGIFIAARPNPYIVGLLKLFPPKHRTLGAEALEESGGALTLWLKGRLISMTVVGLLTGLGLWIIGVPSFLSLGLLSALLEFIPYIGPIISAIPAVLIAFGHSQQAAVWTGLLYLLVQQLEGNLVEPLVQQRAVMIPPALLLFGLIGAGLLFGIIGVLLGAPLIVVSYVLVKRLYVREALQTETPLPTEASGSDQGREPSGQAFSQSGQEGSAK